MGGGINIIPAFCKFSVVLFSLSLNNNFRAICFHYIKFANVGIFKPNWAEGDLAWKGCSFCPTLLPCRTQNLESNFEHFLNSFLFAIVNGSCVRPWVLQTALVSHFVSFFSMKRNARDAFSTRTVIDDSVMEITTLGAGSEVGRSCILLKYKGKTIMLDCGVHPAYSGENSLPLYQNIDVSSVDLLLVSQYVI